ncbi:hypothetical protein BV22DRAFT_645085 [Leucogyrophana mollusca]|uniref:Uncharacterized protein n=1 Tax=Leucogyrophana mollusca TaxID=85980 RepID=A0ACB8B9Y9_9AGAM|nr:hypothetical protein BV22DRAFT_645085 [Leucogyrophana mollusca]
MSDSPPATSELQGPVAARPPFDNPDADIILRSSDNVDLRVFRVILSLVSPIFKDMFSLPQPRSANGEPLSVDLPIIPVTETSSTLENLLLYCYPGGVPQVSNLESASVILEAAIKYDMGPVHRLIGNTLLRFAESDPLSVYAIFSRYGWRDEMQVAARRALELKGLGRPSLFVPEFKYTTVAEYHRLLSYHFHCGVAAQNAGDDLASTCDLYTGCSMSQCHSKFVTVTGGSQKNCSKWWTTYLDESRKELFLRPCGSTLMEPEIFGAALTKASECSSCRTLAPVALTKIRTLYAVRVQEAVDKVKLDFDL